MTKPPIKAFWKKSTAGGQATMVDTPGRCRDLDYCSIGQMRTLVSVPLGQAFVCPECGKPLRPPAMINQPLSRKRLAVWSAGTMGLFVLLYEGMVPSAPKHHLDLAALQQQQQARLAAAAARPAPAPVTPPPLTPPAPIPPPVAQLAPTAEPKPAAPPTVAGPPASPPAATPGTRVTMECSIDAAGVPSNCTAVHDHEQPMPPPLPAPQPAPKPELPPPTPADSDASTMPVAGGMPSYPSDYVRDGRFGEVSVTCLILSTGEAQHCRVHDYIGGRRFAEAVANWLNTGEVRFKPAMHDGHPVAQERHWHIAFPPR